MKKTSLKMLQEPLSLFGILFFGVNATTSYMFYQVNSYKIFLVACAVTLLAIITESPLRKAFSSAPPLRVWGTLSLPLLATIPGYILYKGGYNYNFDYELVSNLVLLLWAGYIYRAVHKVEDLSLFIFFIGVTLIYTGVWAFASRLGWNPFAPYAQSALKVKATFGNRNYYSGFLIQLLPLLLIFSIPDRLRLSKTEKINLKFLVKQNLFTFFSFCLGLLGLLLAQSRVALVGSFVGLLISLSLYTYLVASGKIRALILRGLGIGCIFILLVSPVLYYFKDQLEGSKFLDIFRPEAWFSRLLSWQAAIEAIKTSPWVGYGLGSSYNLFFQFVPPNSRLFHSEHSYNHVHSEYLEYLEEGGLLGACLFLLAWGYIFFLLYRTLKNPSSGLAIKKIAIGIIGGFIAYFLQCFFSVAPRMMVVKLPLFTLLSFVFILDRLSQTNKNSSLIQTPLKQRLTNFVPALIILAIVWALYIPWIRGQYHFVKVRQSPTTILSVKKLEQLNQIHSDVYALSFLSHLNLKYYQPEKLRTTIHFIEQIIPYYRDLGLTKALLAKMGKNYPKAIKEALAYQERDRYFIPVIQLLLELSSLQKEEVLFFQQLQLLTRKLIFDHQLPTQKKEEFVIIARNPLPLQFILSVTESPSALLFQWDSRFIQEFFQFTKNNLSQKEVRIDFIQGFFQTIIRRIFDTPYFALNISQEFLDKQSVIQSKIQQYFRLSQKQQQELRILDVQLRKDLVRSPKNQHTTFQKKHASKTARANEGFRNQFGPIEEYLTHRTNWVVHMRRRKLAESLAQHITEIVFPQIRYTKEKN